MNKIVWYGKEVEKIVESNAMKAIKKACYDVQADVQRSMRHIGGGREYPRGKKIHKASAPGEPPVIDFGRLVNSISVNYSGNVMTKGEVKSPAKPLDGVSKPNTKLTGYVGTNVEYAEELEFGQEERHLEPRPYLRPALERYRSKLVSKFNKLV